MCRTAPTTASSRSGSTAPSSRRASSSAKSKGTGTAFGVALSADPEQRFLYVADGSNERIAILDRASLEEIGEIGGPGRKAGEFYHLHSLGVDPQRQSRDRRVAGLSRAEVRLQGAVDGGDAVRDL